MTDNIATMTYDHSLNAGALTLREYATAEPLPLAVIHEAVLISCAIVTTWRFLGRKRLMPTFMSCA